MGPCLFLYRGTTVVLACGKRILDFSDVFSTLRFVRAAGLCFVLRLDVSEAETGLCREESCALRTVSV